MNAYHHIAFTLVLAAVYPLLPVNGRRALLLLASYAFYAFINVAFVPILVVVTLVSFLGALAIERGRASRAVAAVVILLLLTPLIFYKYWEAWFGAISIPGVPVSSLSFGSQGAVLIPVGLSFYTFQAIGYGIDVQRGATADRNLVRFALFKAFFPQLLAGPIERYHALCPQLWAASVPKQAAIAPAVLLMLYGLFMKSVVGDRIGVAVDEAYLATAPGWRDAVTVTAGFTLQIFADFAGYSLIAVGSARLFGVELTQNFKQPFLSHNLVEFWQRWHISLTRWIGDYLYRPVGRLMWRWTNGARLAAEFSTALVVWTVMGLWHGPTAQFVLFGLLQAFAMQTIKLMGPDRPALLPPWRLAAGMAATFAFVSLTFGLIRTPDLTHYATMMWALLTLAPGKAPAVEPTIVALGLAVILSYEVVMRFWPERLPDVSGPRLYGLIVLLFVVDVLIGYDQTRAFVYFRY